MLSLTSQKRLRILAIILMLSTGINALAAGYCFIIDPSGNRLGMSTSFIQNSPFANFLIPGIILFIFNGILNIFSAIVVMRKGNAFSLLISLQGCILLSWIIVQLTMVESFHPLHMLMGIIGACLIIIGIALK